MCILDTRSRETGPIHLRVRKVEYLNDCPRVICGRERRECDLSKRNHSSIHRTGLLLALLVAQLFATSAFAQGICQPQFYKPFRYKLFGLNGGR